MELGSWGEWLGSLAAIVPAVLWFFDRKDRKAAEGELIILRQQSADAARESQARAVAGWITPEGFFTLHNGSTLPIFDVSATAMLHNIDDEPDFFHIGDWEAIAPGSKELETTYRPHHVLTCFVRFRDSSGSSWERSSTGELRERV